MEMTRATKEKKNKKNCDRNEYHQTVDSEEYERLAGTAGIKGQLYETKLISLINFRLLHDDRVDQFSLASNRNDVGKFDDICFKATIKGFEKEDPKEVTVFIQAKHKENNKRLTFTSETDLVKYFNSYLEIRRAFDPSSEDRFFGGKFDETDCFFVIYTTAEGDPNNKIYEGSFADYLNELIGTGGSCTQPSYTDESLDFLCKIVMKEQIKQLAKFICDKSDSVNWMSNDLILRYHVILAHNVLHVSEIEPEGHRIASFRQDFFTTNEEFIVLFKNTLCLEVLKKRKSKETDADGQILLLKFLSEPSDVTTLSKLIGSVLTYKNSKLEFVGKSMTHDLKRQLDRANVSQSTVYEAAELAAKEYLLSLKLKVPASFGNKDLTIRGKHEKIEKRLNHLTLKIIEILKQSKPNNIVTIDESLGDGFLQLNGGIASAVGNILVFDESSKMLKFTNNCDSLSNLARRWYESLKSNIENLHEYKLDVKVKKFPKLSFEREEYDVSLVRDFYDKLLFYTNQADHKGVREILRREIEDHPCSDKNSLRDRSDLIFLKYHDEIQKLWMTPKMGSYLTKKSKIYENAVTNAMSEPLIMVILNSLRKNKYKKYTFNEKALKPFELHGSIIGTVIATGNYVLTVAKVEQYLGNKDRIVLDLQFIFTLELKEYNTVCKELTNTSKKLLIIVCHYVQDPENSSKRLENIAKAVEGKQIIIVTNKISVDIMTKYFSQASNVLSDNRSVFTDLSVESQKTFLATSTIKVQRKDVSLNLIIRDDESVQLIDEDIFSKLINNETIEIGNTGIYDNATHFYIDRQVSCTKKQEHDKFDDVKDKVVETFYDLEDDVVFITGEKGMGMSTLISHLSMKTKELVSKVWIVRIWLTSYDRIFRKWRETKTAINTLESILSMCEIAIWEGEDYRDDEILIELAESSNGTFSLKKCSGSSSDIFELKIFLDFYNRGKVIFLFEYFDSMGGYEYDCEALSMLKSVTSSPRKNKTWIRCQSNSVFKPILEQEFGPPYKLENFSPRQKDTLLTIFWMTKIQFKNLNRKQMQNVYDFAHFLFGLQPENHIYCLVNPYMKYYVKFLKYLKMEAMANGIDFPNDEYNNFMMRIDLNESTDSCMPDDKTARQLGLIADCFSNKILRVHERDHDLLLQYVSSSKCKWLIHNEAEYLLISLP